MIKPIKIIFFITLIALLPSCKQKADRPSILKIKSVEIAGNVLSKETFEKDTYKIETENGEFYLKIHAELYKVKAYLLSDEADEDITALIINKKEILCKAAPAGKAYNIVFKTDGGKKLTAFTFTAVLKQASENKAELKSLVAGGKSVEIKKIMEVEITGLSERVTVEAIAGNFQTAEFMPPLEEGKIFAPFNKKTELKITVNSSTQTEDYTLFILNKKGEAQNYEQENGIGLKTLSINGKAISPIMNTMTVFIPNDAPYEIPVEASTFNGAQLKFSPPLKNGKLEAGFAFPETKLVITASKKGFQTAVYNIIVQREKKAAELKALTINGYSLKLKSEMFYELSCGREDALIEIKPKNDVTYSCTPSLANGKITVNSGSSVTLIIKAEKNGCKTTEYKLKLTRQTAPAQNSFSRLEGVQIAKDLNQVKYFKSISDDFPSRKESALYEILNSKDYTLKVNKIWQTDSIAVKVNGDAVPVLRKEGHSEFFNISLEQVEPKNSSKQKIEIDVTEKNMKPKTFTVYMCYDGTLAEAAFLKAEYGGKSFVPLLSAVNFLPAEGQVKVSIQPADPLTRAETEEGKLFPLTIGVGNEEKTVDFKLITVSGREIKNKLVFKAAASDERSYLEAIIIYPEKYRPDSTGYSFMRYPNQIEPKFDRKTENYTLKLTAGTSKIFADFTPVIKSADISVFLDNTEIEKELYYQNQGGSEKIYFYPITTEPNKESLLTVKVTSDESTVKTYNIKILSPDDDSVTDFDADFFKGNEKLVTLPPVGQGGLRLPPQNHSNNSLTVKIKPKANGIKVKAIKFMVKDGKPEEAEAVSLDSSGRGTINLKDGMNTVLVEAESRNGEKNDKRIFEIYRFTEHNTVWFEVNGKEIHPEHYMHILGNVSGEITVKAHSVPSTKFALTALDKDYKQIKVERVSGDEFKIAVKPAILMPGVIMADGSKLYYAIILR